MATERQIGFYIPKYCLYDEKPSVLLLI